MVQQAITVAAHKCCTCMLDVVLQSVHSAGACCSWVTTLSAQKLLSYEQGVVAYRIFLHVIGNQNPKLDKTSIIYI